jgi:hypothetical protein
MPLTLVVHRSPGFIGIASVNVPVEMISPAPSGGLCGSCASNSTRWRSAFREDLVGDLFDVLLSRHPRSLHQAAESFHELSHS